MIHDDGTYLAQSDDGRETLWPRVDCPSADEAIEAHVALCDMEAERDLLRLRLAWAWAADRAGWWHWTEAAAPPPPTRRVTLDLPPIWHGIECWCVS